MLCVYNQWKYFTLSVLGSTLDVRILRIGQKLGRSGQNINMRNIWKTVPDSYTITVEQNMWFHGRIYCEKIKLDKIQMADLWLLLTLL